MLNEITNIYIEQLKMYNQVSDILTKFDRDDQSLDITEYLKELEKVDKTMDNIKELNNDLDPLKERYVLEYNLNDFTGDEIKRVETVDSYNEFKNTVDKLSSIIVDIKRMQDRIISNITKQMNITNTLLHEVNSNKRAILSYKKPDDSDKTEFINKKK